MQKDDFLLIPEKRNKNMLFYKQYNSQCEWYLSSIRFSIFSRNLDKSQFVICYPRTTPSGIWYTQGLTNNYCQETQLTMKVTNLLQSMHRGHLVVKYCFFFRRASTLVIVNPYRSKKWPVVLLTYDLIAWTLFFNVFACWTQ